MSSKPIAQDEFAPQSDTKPPLHAVPEASENGAEIAPADQLKSILTDVLGLESEDAAELTADSGLFGHMPELDSMAVAGLLTEIEDRFDIVIEDEDVDGEMLETFGGLLEFVLAKIEQG